MTTGTNALSGLDDSGVPRLRAMGAAALQDSQRHSISTVRQRWEELFADLSAARA